MATLNGQDRWRRGVRHDGAVGGTGTAVVIGAGIGGLVTARVLADRFERVVVVDRDVLPGDASPRCGVPQGNHGHILLVAGLDAMSRLFPGLREELTGAGALSLDVGVGLAVHRFGMRFPALPTGLDIISMSRPLLELTLRRRVAALPQVTFRDRTAVGGLLGVDGRVTGVRISTGGATAGGGVGSGGVGSGGVGSGGVGSGGEEMAADLVVDCTGRGSRSDRWLAALGYPAPSVTTVTVNVSYATRFYRRPAGEPAGGTFVLPTAPAETRVGLTLPVEGDRWLVSLGGWHTEHPPGDPDAFHRYARCLPDPAIAKIVEGAEALTDVVTYRFPSSRRRRFERLRRVPAGYVATADAICSFNPVYGQGMTCATLEAAALGAALDRHGDATAAMVRDFYRAAAAIIATPWLFAVGGDLEFPQTRGPRPPGIRLLNRYSRRVQRAAASSADVRRTFAAVQHLVTPPAALFAPGMVAKVLRAGRRLGDR
jgi:flavin-dependent dehydrogenase